MLSKQFRHDTKSLAAFFHAKSYFVKGSVVSLKIRKNRNNTTRWAFLVSSSIKKNATTRNLTKRRMREAAKKLIPIVKKGLDIVFLLKLYSKRAPSFTTLEDDMIQTLKQWGAL